MTRLLQLCSAVFCSRRLIAAAFTLLLCRDIFLWWTNDDLQGDANFFCDREDFSAVLSPSDFVVTSHRTDCDVLAKDSMTYVYLHRKSEPDRSSNQVFRYDGDTPRIVWTDATHVTIHVTGLSYIGKLVAIFDGINIVGNYRYSSPPEPPLDAKVP